MCLFLSYQWRSTIFPACDCEPWDSTESGALTQSTAPQGVRYQATGIDGGSVAAHLILFYPCIVHDADVLRARTSRWGASALSAASLSAHKHRSFA